MPRGRLAGRPYPSTHHTTLGVEPRTAGRSTGGRRLALVVHRWAASLIAIAAPPCSVGVHSTIDDKIIVAVGFRRAEASGTGSGGL